LVLFSFLTGNADMHLKNFSLLHTPSLGYGLTPAYDLVATALVNPADTEELALTLDGRKKKLKPTDFQLPAQRAGVAEKVLAELFTKFIRVKPAWQRFIDSSFLSPKLRQGYQALLDRRFAQLGLD
jgi:serine/threonine-protein kinase HipA